MTRRTHALRAAGITLLATLALGGCASPGAEGADGSGTTTVKIGMAPYFEYQPWVLADQLGLDEEQGLDFQFTNYTSTDKAVVAAYRGDLDIAPSCQACTLPLMGQLPDIREWMITNQFKGFILIGRAGETETFEELSKEVGDEEAKKQILESLRGKEFAIRSSSYLSLLTAALEQVGMTTDDITIIDFQSDSQAALAFIGGTGDYYIGSLPEEAKLLASPDKYVNAGGTDVLGDAGLWFSTMNATEKWLTENEDLAVKLLAVWYRTMTYMADDPDTMVPMFADAINEATSATLSDDDIAYITTELERFATLDQAETEFYDPESPTYFMKAMDFYVPASADVLPDDYDVDTAVQNAEFFQRLLDDDDLVEWINSPI